MLVISKICPVLSIYLIRLVVVTAAPDGHNDTRPIGEILSSILHGTSSEATTASTDSQTSQSVSGLMTIVGGSTLVLDPHGTPTTIGSSSASGTSSSSTSDSTSTTSNATLDTSSQSSISTSASNSSSSSTSTSSSATPSS
ncbi:hypothetical protein VKT23_000825 [Stygiomarasmius scandens]|uniref:Uncharacterized protein n=1 Tax=Marasmiellus scandens TaxID=2682957 RepID=A0ABR1K7U2_9AGAR